MTVANNSIIVALGAVIGLYIVKEIIYPKVKNKIDRFNNKSKYRKKIQKMTEEGITLDEAKEKLIQQRLGQHFKVEITSYEFDGIHIEQGDKISFNSEDYGYISGKFLGLRECKAEGYTYQFFVHKNDDNVLSIPIEIIQKDTFMVYGR